MPVPQPLEAHMGDRYDRDQHQLRKRYGHVLPPDPILRWGLGEAASIGHNGGPPLEEQPGYLWRRYAWKEAHKKAWTPPSMAVLKFRVARAEAAGLTYQEYMSELLDTGRHLQKEDVERRMRSVAEALPQGAVSVSDEPGQQPGADALPKHRPE
jgi:hypothetical protein